MGVRLGKRPHRSASAPACTDAGSAARRSCAADQCTARCAAAPCAPTARPGSSSSARASFACRATAPAGATRHRAPHAAAHAETRSSRCRVLHQHVVLDRLPQRRRQLLLASPTVAASSRWPTIEPATAAERTVWRAPASAAPPEASARPAGSRESVRADLPGCRQQLLGEERVALRAREQLFQQLMLGEASRIAVELLGELPPVNGASSSRSTTGKRSTSARNWRNG